MRYEDASLSGSFQDQGTTARDDADQLPAGDRGPATGNVITGAGTETGASGADTGAGARVTAVSGAGGSDSTFSGGQLRVEGEHGTLSLSARGDYSYLAKAGTPENSRDTFTYTIADSAGATSQARLMIEIGKTQAVVDANAQRVVPGPDGVVTLPAGVELSDIRIVGRDLLIMLPDGTQMLIVDGAVFVPQLVINDIEVPSTNLAALLIDQEPRPASGVPQSSGGNFIEAVGPLDPGVPLGDLIPPTQLQYVPPEFREANQLLDREPSIVIQTPDQPAGAVSATSSVFEAGLPNRGSEPQGSGEEAAPGANGDTREAVTGTIVINSLDTPNTITINGVVIGAVGQVIQGQYGTLVITSIGQTAIGYSYTLADNTSGDTTRDLFTVTVRDVDGDTATATLTVNVVDDVPTARPDTDSIAAGQFGPATGNVITDAAAGDVGDSDTNAADTVGADNATVTQVTGFNGAADTTFDSSGNLEVAGQYGVLLIKANGDYSYTRNPGTAGGVTDTFTYRLTDGDGDTSSSTLTISIGDLPVTVGQNAAVQLDDETLAGGIPGGVGDVDPNTANTTGTLSASGGDGARTFALSTSGAPSGFTYVASGNNLLIQQNGTTVVTVTLNTATGAYTVVQNAPILHPAGGDENDVSFTLNYSVSDIDGDSANGTLTINVDDDSPTVSASLNREGGVTVDESAPVADSSISFGTSTLVKGDDPHLEGGIAIGSGTGGSAIVSATALFGADGAAAGQPVYALSVTNAVSGLLTTEGTAINLVRLDNGVVVGQVAGTNTVAFAVSINSATGVVTVEQYLSIRHPDSPNNYDEAVSLASGSLGVTVSATDKDGDTAATAAVDVSQVIGFRDDGPALSNLAGASGVSIDETSAVPGGFPISATSAAAVITATAAFGADGPAAQGATLYGLSITGGNGTSSGLRTAVGDQLITLQQVGTDTIQGRYGEGQIAFTIKIGTDGKLTYTQNVALEHSDDGSSAIALNDTNSPLNLAGLVNATITIKDGDNDVASGSAPIGDRISIFDDGPTLNVTQSGEGSVLLTTQDAETRGELSDTAQTSSGNFAGVFGLASTPGADGANSPSLAFALNVNALDSGLKSHGATINLYKVGAVVVGTTGGQPANLSDPSIVFTVEVNAGGTVKLTQYQQIDHTNTDPSPTVAIFDDHIIALGDGKISLTASATITDNDGDFATDSEIVDLGGNLRFADDGPTIAAGTTPNALVASDATLNIDPKGSFAGLFNFDFGADGAAQTGSVNYSLNFNAGPTGIFDTATKLQVTLAKVTDPSSPAFGSVVGIIQTSPGVFVPVFLVAVNATTGEVTLNQIRAVYHSTSDTQAIGDSDAPETLLNNNSITLTATIKDYDGDTASQTVGIGKLLTFQDDFPSIDIGSTDSADNFLITQDADTIGGATDTATSGEAFNGAFFLINENFGGDGEGSSDLYNDSDWSLSLQVAEGTNSGLTIGGVAIKLYINASGVVIGSTALTEGAVTDANTVFTLAVDGDGRVTLQQLQQIDHPIASDPSATGPGFDDHVVSLPNGLVTLSVTANAVDGDQDVASDTASIDLGGNIRFADHGPDANDVNGGAFGENQPVVIALPGTNTFGADGAAAAGSVTILTQPAQGTVTYNPGTNSFTYTPPPGGVSGPLSFTYQLKDYDGDTDAATVTFTVAADSTPTVSVVPLTVDEKGLAARGSESAGTDAAGNSEISATQQMTITTGGDTLAKVEVQNNVGTWINVTGGTQGAPVIVQGNDGFLTVYKDAGGKYVYFYTLTDNLENHPDNLVPPADGDSDRGAADPLAGDSFAVRVTDSDNSVSPSSSIAVTVLDDGPVLNIVDTPNTVVEGQAANGTWTLAQGADSVASVTVSFGAAPAQVLSLANGANFVTLVQSTGTLVVRADGTWTFTAVNNQDNDAVPAPSATFTILATDGDGDKSQDSLTIAITDGPAAGNAQPITLTVDEAALSTAGATGSNPGSPNEVDSTPSLSFTAGSDALTSFSFSNGSLASLVSTLDGAGPDLFWRFSDGTQTSIIGSLTNGGPAAITIAITSAPTIAAGATGNVTVTVTLSDNLPHALAQAAQTQSLGAVTVEARDQDGDVATGVVNVEVKDDIPDVTVTKSDAAEAGISLVTQDAETDGSPTETDTASASFAGAFGITLVQGADGAALPQLTYTLGVAAPVVPGGLVDSGLKSGGATIYLYKVGDNVVGSTATSSGLIADANKVFELSVVASDLVGSTEGTVTLSQYKAIDHLAPNLTSASLIDSLITLTASASVVDGDGDPDSDSKTINIGANITFQDDVPQISASLTGTQLRIDETDNVVAAGGETDGPGGNLGTVTLTAAQLYTVSTVASSADQPETTTYSLLVTDGANSGLLYSSTNQAILLYNAGAGVVEGRVGGSGGAVAFSVTVAVNGTTTLTQFLAIEHPTAPSSYDEDSLALAANALRVQITRTDFDNDSSPAIVDLGSIIRFEDDGPRITAASNINIQNAGDYAATGTFAFTVGSDGPNPGNDDIKALTMSVTIGTQVIAVTPTAGVENAASATYTFSFNYATSASGTAQATGTITFDKVNGTYTVDLDQALQPFTTINSTSQATTFLGYDAGTTTETNSQPDVVNVLLRQDDAATPANEALWVRLTGISGTPSTTSGNSELVAGELITGGQSWVSASNTANGVGGDIVNQDEVLTVDLFTSNQFGNSTSLATASASAIYFKLDNIGNNEDFIVNLKLWSDTNTDGIVQAGEVTTRAVYVANGDIYKGGGGVTAGPGQYSGVSLDNNDGLVIIESNDYNFGSETYRIIGAQIATTDQGLTGSAIDLNRALMGTGAPNNGASVQNGATIQSDSNDLGFKIQDIGFVSTVTNAQTATINLGVTVGDADGDTVTQSLVATVTAAADSSTPIVLSPAVSQPQFATSSLKTADTSTAMFAGLAAAVGMASEPLAAETLDSKGHGKSVGDQFSITESSQPGLVGDGSDLGGAQHSDSLTSSFAATVDAEAAEPTQHVGGAERIDVQFDASGDNGGEAASNLDSGTDVPNAPADAPSFGGGEVQMPSGDQLAAAFAPAAEPVQHNAVVEAVLADALSGGGDNGPSVDQLIDAAIKIANDNGDGGHPQGGVSELATQLGGDVPGWDGGDYGHLSMAPVTGMEAMVLHPDAVQPAVNG